jgi:hypothetical protein
MIKDIEYIKSLCSLNLSNKPGIRSLSFTDADNVGPTGNIDPGATIYHVAFRRWSGSISSSHNLGAGGDYYTKTAQIFVPRYRYACERIITELMDRKVLCIVVDNNGEEHHIGFASFASEYNSGRRANDSSGYQWTFTGRDRRKQYLSTGGSFRELIGENYQLPPGDIGQIGPAQDPAAPIATSCCITIVATPIAEAPLPTGNIYYLNKVVTIAGTGAKYFIDKDGNSILLSGGGMSKERIEGTGAAVYNLTDSYDPDRVIVNRTQNVLQYKDPLTDIDQFKIVDGNVLHLDPNWPLEPGDYIEIYKVA